MLACTVFNVANGAVEFADLDIATIDTQVFSNMAACRDSSRDAIAACVEMNFSHQWAEGWAVVISGSLFSFPVLYIRLLRRS